MRLSKLRLLRPPSERQAGDGEYKHTSSLRVVSIALIGFLLLTIGATMYFVYDSVATGIEQVQSIIVLRGELGVEPIDAVKFTEVERWWNIKHATTTLFFARDPFNAPAVTTTVSMSAR